jgi:ubiquinone/menaquinone biosynthesis C-methylase UbiE
VAIVSSGHRHPIFARFYPHISRGAELHGAQEHRRRMLAGLNGRVIEVGAGHGLNFPYYPTAVTEVVAVEPEPHLRALAQRARRSAPAPVTVLDGLAEALPAGAGEFDAAVTSLVLCSVADQAAALGEIARVLRPGGELRFYEHVLSGKRGAARVQRALDATIYPALAGGCHAARDTAAAIRDAGFLIECEERIAFKPSPVLPTIPHILGVARRPQPDV